MSGTRAADGRVGIYPRRTPVLVVRVDGRVITEALPHGGALAAYRRALAILARRPAAFDLRLITDGRTIARATQSAGRIAVWHARKTDVRTSESGALHA